MISAMPQIQYFFIVCTEKTLPFISYPIPTITNAFSLQQSLWRFNYLAR